MDNTQKLNLLATVLGVIGLTLAVYSLARGPIVKAPVSPAVSDALYSLSVTVCVKGECDEYFIDQNFTEEADCKQEAKARHLDDAPFIAWACVPLDLE